MSAVLVAWLTHPFFVSIFPNAGAVFCGHTVRTPLDTVNAILKVGTFHALVRALKGKSNSGSYLISPHQPGHFTITHI